MKIRLLFSAFAVLFILFPCPAEETAPAGLVRNQSLYIPMRDGVKIAVDLWLPATLQQGQKIPAILKMTSYWRAIGLAERTGAFRLLGAVGVVPTEDFNKPEADAFNAGGYALVYVDARGSGASYGTRPYPFAPEELDDYTQIVDWVVAQAWSNGKVGAMGCAYEGTAAELLTTRAHPAVKAIAPMYSDFDPWLHLVSPGGVLNEWFIQYWRDGTHMLDNNDLVALAKFKGHDVETMKRVVTGVKRVAEDPSGSMLAAALVDRGKNADVYAASHKAEFRDDPFGTGPAFAAFSSYAMKNAIDAAKVPMYVWVGWMDAATVSGALSRYTTFTTPQHLVIGPWGHEGRFDANPFNAQDAAADPTREKRDARLMQFFDDYLKDKSTAPDRKIDYFTMGENKWKTTDVWPPVGFERRTWYLASGNALAADAPTDATTSDTYTVDFSASTGEKNRWRTQAQGDDVVYSDRTQQDAKLLVYTSAPLESNLEITGSPIVTFYASSTADDGAFFAYLECVDAARRVTYLTEGMLHARDRKVSTAEPPYAVFGPYHTHKRADGAPLVPGEITEYTFELIPTSVTLKKGDRIRIALAGHDASCFQRYPASGLPVLTVYRDAAHQSRIELPVR